MNAHRWAELKDAFAALADLSGDARTEKLSELCNSDPELGLAIEGLLAADRDADAVFGRFTAVLQAAPMGSDRAQTSGQFDVFGLSGRTISHFRVGELIGAGGMGVVYRAEDERLGRTVALKLPLPQYALDPLTKERFIQEARAASTLDHPNVCTVYEAGQSDDGQLFLAMACYTGETLKERIAREGTLTVDDALAISDALLRALTAAHAAGIVHRDLKPGNIMITDDGVVKILDFGLAKIRDLTLSGPEERPGTAAYMSPEQLAGESVDGRSDLWSLGVVLYEMLTGKRPFGGGHDLSTIYAIRHDDVVPPSRLREGVPAFCDAVVIRLPRRDRRDRFASAEAVLDELRASPRARAKPWRFRLPMKQAVVAIAMIAAALAVVAVVSRGRNATSPRAERGETAIAVLPFVNTGGDTANEHFVAGLTDELTSALSKVAGLRVSPVGPAARMRRSKMPLRAIAETLKVTTLLEGSAHRDGNRIRVNARLIRAADNSTLWSSQYDRQMSEVFAVQEAIASSVVNALSLSRETSKRATLVGQPTRDLAAYELYQQGKYNTFIRDSVHLAAAGRYLREATAHDSNFAVAYAALADVYVTQSNFGFEDLSTVLPRAEAAANRAIALDSTLAIAHATKGMVFASRQEFAAADASFQRAIALDRSSAWSHHYYSLLLTMMLRIDDARYENRRAVLLDPFAPPQNTLQGVLQYISGKPDSARASLRAAIGLNPNFVVGPYYLGAIDAADGRFDEALALLKQAESKAARFPGVRSALAYTYLHLGRRAESRAMLDSLRRDNAGDRARIDRALGEAVMGNLDVAYAALGHAHWDIPTIHDLVANPLLAKFREDRRYPGLLADMGISIPVDDGTVSKRGVKR